MLYSPWWRLAVFAIALVGCTVAQADVYVKLFPGKEFCVSYEAFRDPEADPVTVSFRHRALDPRLIGIRTKLYGPGKVAGERGPLIPLKEGVDSFGDTVPLYFEAEVSGTYTICLTTPLRQPIMRFEMKFVAANDVVEPPVVEDGAVVVDKPPEVKDYSTRLNMLNVSVQTTVDELRVYEMRRHLFGRTTNSTFNVVFISVLGNMVLAVVLSLWSERFLERYYIKQKSA